MCFFLYSAGLHRFLVNVLDRSKVVSIVTRLLMSSVAWLLVSIGAYLLVLIDVFRFHDIVLGSMGVEQQTSSRVMILTVSHHPTDSVEVVNCCSTGGVDHCSSVGVDRHQCELPKDIGLLMWKSPSWSFSCFTTCQKSSSVMALTWCF